MKFLSENVAKKPVLLSSVIFLLIIISHLWLVEPVMQNGDSAVYNDQIERYDLSIRTTHFGYFLGGMVFNTILPFETDFNINLMCLIMGSLGLISLFWITHYYLKSVKFSLIPVVLGLMFYSFQRGLFLSEVDSFTCSLILMSVALFLYSRTIFSGILYGLAMLSSPLASLSLPLFIFCIRFDQDTLKKSLIVHVKKIAIFGFSSLAVYLPVILWHYQNYFYGGRGLFKAPRLPFSPLKGLERSYTFFTREALMYLPFALFGIFSGVGKREALKKGNLIWGLVIAIFTAALIGERFDDVPVQLPNMMMITTVVAYAFWVISKRSKAIWAVVILIALNGAWYTYPRIYKDVDKRAQTRELYVSMQEKSGNLPILVAGFRDIWNDANIFERIIYKRTKIGKGMSNNDLKKKAGQISNDKQDYYIWFLDKPKQSDFKLLLNKYELKQEKINNKHYHVFVPKR